MSSEKTRGGNTELFLRRGDADFGNAILLKVRVMDRRELIQFVAGTVAASMFVKSDDGGQGGDQQLLEDGATVLFQGDSITDARRDKKKFADRANDPRALGDGYPFLIAGPVLRENPSKGYKFYNRGISGNRVPHLQNRWQRDCLDIKPALLSILVGVNDIWHKMNGRYDGTVEDYRTGFTELLGQTKEALPDLKLVICEPFALRCGAVKEDWYPEFDQRRAVAADVAKAAGAIWVPFQTMFDTAIAEGTTPQYWAPDGVHPSIAGHTLMAETWRKCVGL